jgi:hypothetical protein
MWGGYDMDDPSSTSDPRNTYDSQAGSQRTTEFIVSIERELLPDFGVAADFSYRKFDQFNYTYEYDPDTGERTLPSDYVEVGTIPDTLGSFSAGDAAGRPYYLKGSHVPYRWYRYIDRRPNYYRDYMGFEVRANKRLSNKWMLNASFTYQLNNTHYGDNSLLNITNKWALDGNIYAPSMGGGSGKIGTPHHSSWLFKVSGLYQLPLDFNISFTFNARQGNPVFETANIRDINAPNSRNTSVGIYLYPPDHYRLPNFFNLNLRLEKVVRVGDTGRIYIMADLFNVFNQATMLRRYEQYHGQYNITAGTMATWGNDFKANEILNPRVLRFGVRFQF